MHDIYIIYILCMPSLLYFTGCGHAMELVRNQVFHPSTSIKLRIFHVGIGKVRGRFVSVVTGIIIKGLTRVYVCGSPSPVWSM